ncbi:uncharacterized protein LOC124156609 isoform X2 [Ischnura elegans]|uniref:uncharacterized protein LOC124156609 isoform X2 n=1 Tax=Ischnura elegans TaxID=197161 RepID=UPI001ED8A1EA|nr:uncharacterized protein LOC124156609 isoform X2 [Ischnura elegans]
MQSTEEALETDSNPPLNDNSNVPSSREDRPNGSDRLGIVSDAEMGEGEKKGLLAGEGCGNASSNSDQPQTQDGDRGCEKPRDPQVQTPEYHEDENAPRVSLIPGFGMSSDSKRLYSFARFHDTELRVPESMHAKDILAVPDIPDIVEEDLKGEYESDVQRASSDTKYPQMEESHSALGVKSFGMSEDGKRMYSITKFSETKLRVLPGQGGQRIAKSTVLSTTKLSGIIEEEVLPGEERESSNFYRIYSDSKVPGMENTVFPDERGESQGKPRELQRVHPNAEQPDMEEEEEILRVQGVMTFVVTEEGRIISTVTEFPDETDAGVEGSENLKEGACLFTKYPESVIKERRRWRASKDSSLERLPEHTSEWDAWWGPEEPSPRAVSVDEQRVRDPLGAGKMEARWWLHLLDTLESQQGFARLYRPLTHSADGSTRSLTDSSADEQSDGSPVVEGSKAATAKGTEARFKRRERAEIFWSRSRYEGFWDEDLDVASGKGIYRLPYGVTYAGELHDGRFDGHGVLRYPDGTTVEGNWSKGHLLEESLEVTFRDGLTFDLGDWDYCIPPDRRFQVERLYGARGAGRVHLSNAYPTPRIPQGCYDTGDGFFDARTRCVTSAPPRPPSVLRIVIPGYQE